MTFKKKPIKLTGITDTWAKKQIRKKNEVSCVLWFSLRELVQNHLDILKRVDLFALAIYGLVVFLKVLGHKEVLVVDFFKKLRQGINPIPAILTETFRFLSSCRRKGEGRFIGCAQLLNAWIFSHFWKVERTPFHMFSKTFAPLEAYLEKDWSKDVTEQHWVSIFQNLYAEDITWKAPLIHSSLRDNSYQLPVDWRNLDLPLQYPFSEEMPSKLEMARHEFEFEKVQNEAEFTRKDLRDLHLENKKLRGTIRNSGLSKSLAERKEELSNIKYGMEFWRGKMKKEEEKSARAMIELKKKKVKFEIVSAELMTSQSEHQELKGRKLD
ncbi:hypothetical protein Godav_029533 [Gossypium davidsonii]|uniref:DUF7745 domain-containing protein n=1 Tax=Gossypium davidsonii TaxID=34287 RepID=A0A7J8T6W3_GOSDV|nr:hypothetical protein [Gossypium davidsonii]